MFGVIAIVIVSIAAICGVGGCLLWRRAMQAQRAARGSFVDRVRRRANLLWKAEGCPPDHAEQHWRAAEAVEMAADGGSDASLSRDIEELQFRSDLAEVQLLLDFISGRPDKAFVWRTDLKTPDGAPPMSLGADAANSSATALAQAIASDRITPRELKQIATIRFPPNKTFEANAADAALLIAVRDKLNQLVRPASGLTIAFTLRTWAPWRISSKRSGREWARWKLAAAAHPQLGSATTRFRLSAYAFSALALLATFSTVWMSNEVATGAVKLNRIQALDQKRSAMAEVIRQADAIEAAPNAINLGKGATAEHSFVERYCDKRELIQPVTDIADRILVGKFDSAHQYATCDYDRLTSQIRTAQDDLTHWWMGSFLVVTHCRIVQWRGAGCTASPEWADQQSPFYFPTDIADIMASFSNIWLPMLYGFSGALVAALRTIYRKISASTLAPWDTRLLWTRMVLGLIAGSCVGLFFAPSGTSVQGSSAAIGALSLSAIAFLAGYAVDGLFGFLDEIVHCIFHLKQEGSQTAK